MSGIRWLAIVLCTCLLGALGAACAPSALAQGKTAGSPLQSPANYPYDCSVRWMPAGISGFDQPLSIPGSTCTLIQPGTNANDTFLVPGPGKVTKARIKSGPNPAPVSIATLRRYFRPNAQGQMEYTCCYGVSETAVVQPTPNAITEIPVDLLVDARQPANGQTGLWDIVAVNVRGPGSLPMSELSPQHPSQYGSSTPSVWWQFPHTAPGDNNPSDWMSSNFEVLMQFDWTPCTAAARAGTVARAAQACPGAGGGSGGGGAAIPGSGPPKPPVAPASGPPAPIPAAAVSPAPASVASSRLVLRDGKVRVAVTCAATTACKGRVRLRTAARRAQLLASKAVSLRAGRSGSVSLALPRKSRRLVKAAGTAVVVEVDLGASGTVTRRLTLKPAR